LLGGASQTISIGVQYEFPSWNPLDWEVGSTIGTTATAKTGLYGEFGPKISTSLYIWDKGEPIKTGFDKTPVTTCVGGGGSVGIGVSRGYCQGGGKHGVKIGFSASPSVGVYGYTSIGVSMNNAKSNRKHWDDTVRFFNDLTRKNQTNEYFYQHFGQRVGSGVGAWGSPPSRVK
jgi:hypothetical protein